MTPRLPRYEELQQAEREEVDRVQAELLVQNGGNVLKLTPRERATLVERMQRQAIHIVLRKQWLGEEPAA